MNDLDNSSYESGDSRDDEFSDYSSKSSQNSNENHNLDMNNHSEEDVSGESDNDENPNVGFLKLSDLPMPEGFVNRTKYKNNKKTTLKMRRFALCLIDEQKVRDLEGMYLTTQQMLQEPNITQELTNKLTNVLEEVKETYIKICSTVIPPRMRKGSRIVQFKTVSDLLQKLGENNQDAEQRFINFVGFSSEFVTRTAQLLYANGSPTCKTSKKGDGYGAEWALLLVLIRLHEGVGRDFFALDDFFGVASTTLQCHFLANIAFLDEKFSCLVDLKNINRFQNRIQMYKKCIQNRISIVEQKKGSEDDSAKDFLNGVAFIFDGFRQETARAQDSFINGVLYSGYTKDHNILWGGLGSPDGIITLAGVVTGRNTDVALLQKSNLEIYMAALDAKVLTDSIFSTSNIIRAIPKRRWRVNIALHALDQEEGQTFNKKKKE